MNILSKVVEEFVKNSPSAWAHMCEYHRAQAAGRLGGYLLLVRRMVPTVFKRANLDATDDNGVGNSFLFFFILCLGASLTIWGASEMPATWGALFAPERDAAIDVLRMGR